MSPGFEHFPRNNKCDQIGRLSVIEEHDRRAVDVDRGAVGVGHNVTVRYIVAIRRVVVVRWIVAVPLMPYVPANVGVLVSKWCDIFVVSTIEIDLSVRHDRGTRDKDFK